MKLIIAGSRHFKNEHFLFDKINEINDNYKITKVICGKAPGTDTIGEKWGKLNNIEVDYYPADWNDLISEPVFIKLNKYNKEYNALAGFARNEKMAKNADALAIFFKKDAKNKGSNDMMTRANNHGLTVFYYEL